MRKHEFLEELLHRLAALPQEERDKAYAFYAEMIDDSIEDGMSEDEAVEKLGSVEDAVERIIAEVPMKTLITTRVKNRNRSLYFVVLLIVGFPIWLPILASVFSVLFSLFISVWAVVLALWAVFASVAAAVVGSLAGLVLYPEFSIRLLLFGAALACAGVAMLLYQACIAVTREFAYLTWKLFKRIKRALMKRGGHTV